jgi:N-acylglucosamine 2-epimerase
MQAMTSLLPFYRDHVERVLLPFWRPAVDTELGGIFTCFNNTGGTLVSTDKYTWSQGRFVWMWSRIARMIRDGMLAGDADLYLRQARQAATFLRQNVFLPNGNCVYVLSAAGDKKSDDSSLYADCFVLLGFSEYAAVAEDWQMLHIALLLYDRLVNRLDSGNFRTDPYPIPAGYAAHSLAMIQLRFTQSLAAAAGALGHRRSQELAAAELAAADALLSTFTQPDGTVAELIPADPAQRDTLLARHATPGHVCESMWFVLLTAAASKRREWIAPACRSIEWAVRTGWDAEYGGLFRYTDREGGRPRGITGDSQYEALMLDTWDTKIWWPHSEALFSTLLASKFSALEPWHTRIHEYVFRTFPNPDPRIGEWIQIRDRRGAPLDKVVALPVKDPYHILQNLLLCVELLHTEGQTIDYAPVGRLED